MEKLRVIIPAAGKGTRLQAICGDLPKAMFRVGDRPMLEIVLENIAFVENEDTYIVVGYGKEKIIDHFHERFHYIEQKEQLGTGHAVMVCADDFSDYDGNVYVIAEHYEKQKTVDLMRKICYHIDDKISRRKTE